MVIALYSYVTKWECLTAKIGKRRKTKFGRIDSRPGLLPNLLYTTYFTYLLSKFSISQTWTSQTQNLKSYNSIFFSIYSFSFVLLKLKLVKLEEDVFLLLCISFGKFQVQKHLVSSDFYAKKKNNFNFPRAKDCAPASSKLNMPEAIFSEKFF